MAKSECRIYEVFPNEIIIYILCFLGIKDIANTRLVSKDFYAFAVSARNRILNTPINYLVSEEVNRIHVNNRLYK
jgi:F-box domain